MNLFLLHLLLILAWLALTGKYAPGNIAVGFFLGLLILWLLHRGSEASHYLERLAGIPGFILFFAWELTKANLRVARDVLTPGFRMRPAIIALPLDVRTDLEITVLAMLITLTPGSLTLDISRDRQTLFVHTLFGSEPDRLRRSMKDGLERRVRKVFQ